MRKKSIAWILIGMMMLICIIEATPAFPYSSLPGLAGLVIGSTSDSGISSSLSLSSSTNIVSTGPSTPSTPSGQQTGAIMEKPPDQWQPGVREGIYYDPLSKTSWVYDRILKKYYCPDKGWFLIGQYSTGPNPQLLKQYYYDPKNVVLMDMKTGATINIDQNGVYGPSSATATVTSNPTPYPTSSTTTLMSSQTGVSVTGGGQNTDPCLVSCSDCPSGSCRDCNHNGICDDSEGTTPSQSPTQGGISEAPQSAVLPEMASIPGCDLINCSTCFGKVCYDCNGDKICDDPQPTLTGKGI